MIVGLALVAVGLIAAAVGGYAIPLGFLIGVSPLAIYIAATVGGVLGSVFLVFLYSKLWEKMRMEERFAGSSKLDRAKRLPRNMVRGGWGWSGR